MTQHAPSDLAVMECMSIFGRNLGVFADHL